MIHVGMNIPDKSALFREVRRVLGPNRVFGIYDMFRNPGGSELAYPVPWSKTPETSFLASVDDVEPLLDEAGFDIERQTDRTEFALEFFHRLREQASESPPPLGFHLLMGDDFPLKAANILSNIQRGRCAPWEIVCRSR